MTALQFKSNFKKIIISILLAFSISLSYFVGFNFNTIKMTSVSAYQKEIEELISNSKFNSMGAGTPANPSGGWTFNNINNNKNIIAGIINVYDQDNTFTNNNSGDTNKYKLNSNPGTVQPNYIGTSTDATYKHLMINSPEDVARANYQSPNFTLSKGSYYALEIWAKTSYDTIRNEDNSQTRISANASIYLTGLKDSNQENGIEYFSTYGEWFKYTLFIATNPYNDESVNLEFWLGGNDAALTSKGAVFVNEISAFRYNQTTFLNAIETARLNQDSEGAIEKYIVIDLNKTAYEPFENASFEKEDNSYNDYIVDYKTLNAPIYDTQALKVVDTKDYNKEQNFNINNPLTNGNKDNENVLFIYSETDSYIGIESQPITIKKQQYYRLSVWAKSNYDSNNATLILVEQNPDENNKDFVALEKSLPVSLTANENSPQTNGWTLYSFYIEGNALQDKTVKLQLWLGTQENPTRGYIFFDDITMQEINYDKYSANSSATNNIAMSFNENNNQFTIPNGNFNLTNNKEDSVIYPLTPRNWTLTTDTNFDIEESISGVVNTDETQWNNFKTHLANSNLLYKDTPIDNPGIISPLLNPYNNVLMIGNPILTTQTYTSESFSLDQNAYYKLTFSVATQRLNQGSAKFKLVGSNYTLFELPNIETINNEWQTYNLYIKTNKSVSATIELSLVEATGFAFFDNIELHSITETTFDSKTTNAIIRDFKINLKDESFDLYTFNPNGATHLPFNWTGTNNTSKGTASYGVLNIDNAFIPSNNIKNPGVEPSTSGKNVLYITSGDSDTNFTVTSNDSISLNSGEYYKISVWVKTIDIDQEAENVKYQDKENTKPYLPGASIKLSGFEQSFTGIDTQRDSVNQLNNWKKYTFYVKPTSNVESQLVLGLGYEDALTSGFAYFDEITVETLDEATYKSEVENIGDDTTKLLLTELEKDTETPEDTTKPFKGNKFDFLLVSSLITSIAILIAVLGVLIRKVNIAKFLPAPKIKTSYDRRKTIEVEMNKKERIAFRQAIIEDLRLEFNEIDKEIADYLSEYEKEKQELERKAEERRQHYEAIKQAIIVEIQSLTKAYEETSSKLTDATEKQKAQKQYEKQLAKLEAKQREAEIKANEKLRRQEIIAQRREQYLARQAYRKQLIQEEIERIEREIEEIARQEEKMWNEYRKAKEEAKKAKMEYMAKLRAEKRKAREEKQNKQQTVNFENTSITSEDIVEVDDNKDENK